MAYDNFRSMNNPSTYARKFTDAERLINPPVIDMGDGWYPPVYDPRAAAVLKQRKWADVDHLVGLDLEIEDGFWFETHECIQFGEQAGKAHYIPIGWMYP